MVPPKIWRFVKRRARFRCEYCRIRGWPSRSITSCRVRLGAARQAQLIPTISTTWPPRVGSAMSSAEAAQQAGNAALHQRRLTSAGRRKRGPERPGAAADRDRDDLEDGPARPNNGSGPGDRQCTGRSCGGDRCRRAGWRDARGGGCCGARATGHGFAFSTDGAGALPCIARERAGADQAGAVVGAELPHSRATGVPIRCHAGPLGRE